MLIATTETIEGRRIVKYCGIALGQAVEPASLLNQLSAGVMESKYFMVRTRALQQMEKHAEQLGANAIVGMTIEVSPNYPRACCTGTAVVLE